MLDDAERQSIREWFRGLVKARTARGAAEAGGEDETARLTRDLQLPGDVASDVKGGSEGPPSPEPPPGK